MNKKSNIVLKFHNFDVCSTAFIIITVSFANQFVKWTACIHLLIQILRDWNLSMKQIHNQIKHTNKHTNVDMNDKELKHSQVIFQLTICFFCKSKPFNTDKHIPLMKYCVRLCEFIHQQCDYWTMKSKWFRFCKLSKQDKVKILIDIKRKHRLNGAFLLCVSICWFVFIKIFLKIILRSCWFLHNKFW